MSLAGDALGVAITLLEARAEELIAAKRAADQAAGRSLVLDDVAAWVVRQLEVELNDPKVQAYLSGLLNGLVGKYLQPDPDTGLWAR